MFLGHRRPWPCFFEVLTWLIAERGLKWLLCLCVMSDLNISKSMAKVHR
jgi:hypothetical protein